jgi:hypothetical protein
VAAHAQGTQEHEGTIHVVLKLPQLPLWVGRLLRVGTVGLLAGDPAHFAVVGGANPHTRDKYGRKKSVDRALAIRQWGALRDLLVELDVRVEVIPPDPAHPGLVYPANAGFRHGELFVLSNLTPTRAGEQPAYRRAVESLGLPCVQIAARFEAMVQPVNSYLLALRSNEAGRAAHLVWHTTEDGNAVEYDSEPARVLATELRRDIRRWMAQM